MDEKIKKKGYKLTKKCFHVPRFRVLVLKYSSYNTGFLYHGFFQALKTVLKKECLYCTLLTGSFHLQGHSIEGIQEELQRQDRQPMEPQSTKPLLSGCPLWPQEICQLLEIAQFCMADFWIQIWYLSSAFFGRLCSNSSKFFQLSFYIWVQPLFWQLQDILIPNFFNPKV